ncbi:myosin heavy chain-like protein [Rhynchospora pubera]|uniref:Myosin heavy chain-like protein n=1 Tax=Rhynchospora pubera TaxID=906938 RepID=A0AAV8HC17_9POAL|nr:myosin heavy chain-like protein [Rhynchospora pubera]
MASRSSNGSGLHMHRQKLGSNGLSATISNQKENNCIENLERELKNCYQEIDYLQDQLNLRSSEASFMGEHIHSLEIKVRELETLNEKLSLMENELQRSESQCLDLIHELEHKEEELHNSVLQVQKLEMVYLDSQCEIESLKLDFNEMEQRLFESREAISQLEAENKELHLYRLESRRLFSKAEAQLEKLLENLSVHLGGKIEQEMLLEMRKNLCFSDDLCSEEPLGPLFSKLAIVATYDHYVEIEMKKMRDKVEESEILVNQLKEELHDEKRKAKEDAEDLTQEMAELRYQITGMLDEECKHRALIEEASIKRIKELEEQVKHRASFISCRCRAFSQTVSNFYVSMNQVMKERRKATSAIKRYQEAHELAERQTLEIKRLKGAIERLHSDENLGRSKRIESCSCGFCAISSEQPDFSSKGPVSPEFSQALLDWHPS